MPDYKYASWYPPAVPYNPGTSTRRPVWDPRISPAENGRPSPRTLSKNPPYSLVRFPLPCLSSHEPKSPLSSVNLSLLPAGTWRRWRRTTECGCLGCSLLPLPCPLRARNPSTRNIRRAPRPAGFPKRESIVRTNAPTVHPLTCFPPFRIAINF